MEAFISTRVNLLSVLTLWCSSYCFLFSLDLCMSHTDKLLIYEHISHSEKPPAHLQLEDCISSTLFLPCNFLPFSSLSAPTLLQPFISSQSFPIKSYKGEKNKVEEIGGCKGNGRGGEKLLIHALQHLPSLPQAQSTHLLPGALSPLLSAQTFLPVQTSICSLPSLCILVLMIIAEILLSKVHTMGILKACLCKRNPDFHCPKGRVLGSRHLRMEL